MKTIVMLLAIFITYSSFGQAKLVSTDAKAEKEILAIEDEYVALGKKSDFEGIAAFMEKYATENGGAVLGNGEVGDKAAAIKGLRAIAEKKDPDLLYETFVHDERQVQVYGEAAIFSAKATWRTQGEAKTGKAPREARFTHFFVKQNGAWKMAKAHITDLPQK